LAGRGTCAGPPSSVCTVCAGAQLPADVEVRETGCARGSAALAAARAVPPRRPVRVHAREGHVTWLVS
jgi:hypothetical protein